MSRQHEDLHGITQERDDAISAKDETIAKLEKEVASLKDYVLKVPKEGFRQVVFCMGCLLIIIGSTLTRMSFKVSLFLLRI